MYQLKQKIIYNQLPSVLNESYINADGAALKVAIYMLIHEKASIDELKSNLPISDEAIKRSLLFWEENGLIENRKDVSSENIIIKTNKLSHDEMSKAVLLNPEISVLLQESQQILGRELPISDSRILIEIYQNLLPSVYAILILESFWITRVPNKKVLNETLYSAREWNNLGIKEESEYDIQIKRMEKKDAFIKEVSDVLSISPDELSRKQRKIISSWIENYSYDKSFVSEVLLRKPDATIPYINTVLKNWYQKGYKKISDTRDVPVNISDNNSNGDLSPLFATLLKKKQG